eukprot:gene8230-9077_t
MDATLAVQLQIRQNAEEISSVLRELQGWEKAVQGKDKALRGQKKKAQLTASAAGGEGVRVSGGAVPLKTSSSTLPQQTTDSAALTPASIVDRVVGSSSSSSSAVVPRPLGTYQPRDVEEVERERGNAEFKAGRFEAAVRCYTKCLGLKARNCLAFSNRAMAFLKMREFSRALSDCNSALAIAPQHVKSLLRRASALAALGRLRAALRDLRQVLEAEPNNKQARADLLQVREQLRNAVARAPLVAVRSAEAILQGRQQKQEELEKALLQAGDDVAAVERVVRVQAMPGIDRILRGAMEPEALLLLLRALLLLHRRHRLSASQTSHYLLRISRAPNFSFLRALLPRQQQEEVAEQVEVLLAEQEEEGSKALREAYRVV